MTFNPDSGFAAKRRLVPAILKQRTATFTVRPPAPSDASASLGCSDLRLGQNEFERGDNRFGYAVLAKSLKRIS
jgi:hypothetical protein